MFYNLYTKCPFRWGGSGPTEYMVYWAHQSTHPIRHFDRFSRFSTAHGRRGVTSSQTHTCIHIHNERGELKTRDWKSQDWKTWDQIAGGKRRDWITRDQISRGGTGKRGNIIAWVAKCNCRNTACRNKTVPVGTVPTPHFYRAMLCIHGTSHGPVSVCVCVCV